MPLDYPVLSLSWNKEGKQLLIGGEILSLWAYSVNENGSVLLPDPDSSVTGEGGSEGVWGELWRCALALPAVHLMFSPDGTMFATASKDDHFVKIWYHSKAGVCVCVYIYVCVCACVRTCVCVHTLSICMYLLVLSMTGAGGLGTGHMFSYVYVAHPMMVTGLVWRKTSSFMPK